MNLVNWWWWCLELLVVVDRLKVWNAVAAAPVYYLVKLPFGWPYWKWVFVAVAAGKGT